MTSQTLNITEALVAKLQNLPPEQQQTVLDFAVRRLGFMTFNPTYKYLILGLKSQLRTNLPLS